MFTWHKNYIIIIVILLSATSLVNAAQVAVPYWTQEAESGDTANTNYVMSLAFTNESEITNGIYTDSSSYGNDATQSVAGKRALWTTNGLDFDGVDDRAGTGDSGSGNSLSTITNLTLSCWVVHDNTASEICLSKAQSGGDSEYSLAVTASNTPQFAIYQGGVLKINKGKTPIGTGSWVHLVGVYDGTNLITYLNGVVEDANVPITGLIDDTAQQVFVGWGWTDLYAWDGLVDEPKIFPQAFTSNEVFDLYNEGH